MRKILLLTLFCTASFLFAVCEKLGPVPVVDCMKGKVLPTHYEGKKLEKRDGKFFLNGILDPDFRIYNVDRPALATFGETGGVNSRLGHMRIKGIEWVFICRTHEQGVSEGEYNHKPVGLIGFNPETGETCFTDMYANSKPSGDTEPPNAEYCVGCHNNNSPWILTPYLNQSAIGGETEIVPLIPKEKLSKPGWGYKVYGISEEFRKSLFGVQPKNPDGSVDKTCTSCHTISNTFKTVLYDAVGKGTSNKAKTKLAHSFSYNYWMPPDPLVLNESQWKQKYGEAVDRLLYCVNNDDRSKCEKRTELVLPVQ